MALAATITVDPRRGLTSISPLIYGQFLEHFHRQVFHRGAYRDMEVYSILRQEAPATLEEALARNGK
jgi:hypothetical protein